MLTFELEIRHVMRYLGGCSYLIVGGSPSPNIVDCMNIEYSGEED